MENNSVQTTIDIPADLYRQLEEKAAVSGKSVAELVLVGATRLAMETENQEPYRVKFPLFGSDGPKIDLTNEDIYGDIEFP